MNFFSFVFSKTKKHPPLILGAAFLIIHLVFWSCASQSMPTGGPKDVTPPVLISTYPQDQSTNFDGDMIILEFDEDIKTQRLQEQLQISPFTEVKYKSVVKRNRLTLKFDEPFAPNTTYTFTFGDGVVDFNEGNKPKNIKLAFSTGDEIDSLLITGTVQDLMTGKKLNNVMVGLFDAEDSLDITNRRPLYLSLTDSTGRYVIENIKSGKYKAYALAENKDKRDYIYNKNTELIGFYSEPLQIGTSYAGVNFQVLRYDILPFKFLGARQRAQYFEIKFNKNLADFEIEYLDEDKEIDYDTLFYPVREGEYINFYNLNSNTEDSIRANMTFIDSIGNTIDTTLLVQFGKVRKPRESSFTVREEPPSNTPILPDAAFDLKLVFNKPLWKVAYDSIILGFQSDSIGNRSTAADWKLNKNRTELYFTKPIEITAGKEGTFKVQMREKTFVSIENDTIIEAKNLQYSRGTPEEYGVITGKVIGKYDSFIIEVIDEEGKVEKRLKNQRNYKFDNLGTGKKTIRVLVDENGNGEWDSGEFEEKILPEPVFHLNREIEIKANWEFADVDIDLGG